MENLSNQNPESTKTQNKKIRVTEDLPPGYTIEQLRQHYAIEKELAARLRTAPFSERRNLYSSLYDELFTRVPWHVQLRDKKQGRNLDRQMKLLRPFLHPETVMLEIGAGDCALSFEASRQVKKVYALDVSDVISSQKQFPSNVELILSDGVSIPLPDNSVDLIYSNQLIEHLHPDDVQPQLAEIWRALKPGGITICITPNRISGPHDISRYFDEVACGFHLKEYTFSDLRGLFQKVGFRRLAAISKIPLFPILPIPLYILLEKTLSALPFSWRKSIARNRLMDRLLYIRLLAYK